MHSKSAHRNHNTDLNAFYVYAFPNIFLDTIDFLYTYSSTILKVNLTHKPP